MTEKRRSDFAGGLVLILLGAFVLILRLFPNLSLGLSWPLFIVGFGVLLLVIGILTRVPGLAVPACIIGGIGGLLYWQNATENWESWAYAWTLIPGFVGVGVVLSGLLGGKTRSGLGAGSWLIVISLVLYLVFASAFGGIGEITPYWPALIIALGVIQLVLTLFRRR